MCAATTKNFKHFTYVLEEDTVVVFGILMCSCRSRRVRGEDDEERNEKSLERYYRTWANLHISAAAAGTEIHSSAKRFTSRMKFICWRTMHLDSNRRECVNIFNLRLLLMSSSIPSNLLLLKVQHV